MTMTDPLADMLTRIRNAHRAEKVSVSMPHSNIKAAVAKVLADEGYIAAYRTGGSAGKPTLELDLKYHSGRPVIETLQRFSTPGRRVYRGAGDVPRVKNGFGVAIVSTSRGLMSDREARAAGIGGEVLLTVT